MISPHYTCFKRKDKIDAILYCVIYLIGEFTIRKVRIMEVKISIGLKIVSNAVLIFLTFTSVFAEEKIVQDEKISLEKCLEVIRISADKLSITPEIKKLKNEKHVASFSLTDGTLKITCDGEDGRLIVSTTTN